MFLNRERRRQCGGSGESMHNIPRFLFWSPSQALSVLIESMARFCRGDSSSFIRVARARSLGHSIALHKDNIRITLVCIYTVRVVLHMCLFVRFSFPRSLMLSTKSRTFFLFIFIYAAMAGHAFAPILFGTSAFDLQLRATNASALFRRTMTEHGSMAVIRVFPVHCPTVKNAQIDSSRIGQLVSERPAPPSLRLTVGEL